MRRLFPIVSVGIFVVVALVVALVALSGRDDGAERKPAQAHRKVLAISIDGFNPDALTKLGAAKTPNIHRLIDEGASTLNARTAYEKNITLPNHTGMVTSDPIDTDNGGHGVTWNVGDPNRSIAKSGGKDEQSVFTTAHEAGLSTGVFVTKQKFELWQRAWEDDIDTFEAVDDHTDLVPQATDDLADEQRDLTFVHLSLPDVAGHESGGMSPDYLAAVEESDAQVGEFLDVIDADAELKKNLDVILTADHGFKPGVTNHSEKVYENYRIPFIVWGPDAGAGTDLYDLNSDDYRDPGKGRPGYDGTQPVRNADLGNLALDLLGLGPIPTSDIGKDQTLDVK
ncbi:type I phosphodiesterase/nucleotide pyrophosphatase [Nocardioides albertanoniae]|uniref:Type I phosphodiesterase/nucleotide pyrophosphatase n=1 Tax=Nocardioides albertanoniae TaxID=1175486 RepID=A0A543AAJ4_9ACTN|nr:alkaline phosphatase family protein [Nocardioides albertanoniae]TQL69623.1 type I phosphodiesterase/nucleotide pyrophosphatase [Nocardioides albertanoniae]